MGGYLRVGNHRQRRSGRLLFLPEEAAQEVRSESQIRRSEHVLRVRRHDQSYGGRGQHFNGEGKLL